MGDASWDKNGLPAPKKGPGTGMNVLLGCGVFLLLVVITCTVGGAVLGTYFRKDPKVFELGMERSAQGLVQKDWERLRALVDQIQTDEGARIIYLANGESARPRPPRRSSSRPSMPGGPRWGPCPRRPPRARGIATAGTSFRRSPRSGRCDSLPWTSRRFSVRRKSDAPIRTGRALPWCSEGSA